MTPVRTTYPARLPVAKDLSLIANLFFDVFMSWEHQKIEIHGIAAPLQASDFFVSIFWTRIKEETSKWDGETLWYCQNFEHCQAKWRRKLENWVPTTLSASNFDELQTIENATRIYLGYLDNLLFASGSIYININETFLADMCKRIYTKHLEHDRLEVKTMRRRAVLMKRRTIKRIQKTIMASVLVFASVALLLTSYGSV